MIPTPRRRSTAGKPPPPRENFCAFGDVGAACHTWLMKHDPAYRRHRELHTTNNVPRRLWRSASPSQV